MEIPKRSLRIDDEVLAVIQALPGQSINDKLRGRLIDQPGQTGESPALLEILDHVRSMAGTLPDCDQVETIVEAVVQRKIDERGFNPASIPGVQVGAARAAPRKYQREDGTTMSWAERKEVDRREHLEQVAAQDSTATERRDIEYDPAV